MKMVTHVKLQYYRHNYCLVCMTGLLGCRWHRYKQSTRDSRKRDLLVFTLLTVTFLFSTFMLYFITVAHNDFNDFNGFFFKHLSTWIPMYTILLTVISILFAYLVFLMILAICHLLHGHQLYTHLVHIVLFSLCLVIFIVSVVFIQEFWEDEWTVTRLSLKIIGPFLQIGAVVVMTILSWVIARQWYTLSKAWLQVLWLFVYIIVMLGLYISPLFINSPCVKVMSKLPPPPKLFAHRGASAIAPENTLASFQIADEYSAFGFETDVRISFDGTPFLMHDSTFRRTTNIATVYPDLEYQDVSSFNISQIKKLNAGNWFLEKNPMGTLGDLTEKQKSLYMNQTVPTLAELIRFANLTSKTVMFDLRPPPESHPYYNQTVNKTEQAIKEGGIPASKIWWHDGSGNNSFSQGFSLATTKYVPSAILRMRNISRANMQNSKISEDNILEYQSANISTNIYLVNSKWYYSLYWCMDVYSVATNNVHSLSGMESPVWHLSPRNYLILWITVDVISALIVITAFIVQRIWWSGSKYSPERLSISSNEHGVYGRKTGTSSQSTGNKRQMKEKLIMQDVAADIFDDDTVSESEDYGIESNYTVQSTDGREMARIFHGTTQYQRDKALELNRVNV